MSLYHVLFFSYWAPKFLHKARTIVILVTFHDPEHMIFFDLYGLRNSSCYFCQAKDPLSSNHYRKSQRPGKTMRQSKNLLRWVVELLVITRDVIIFWINATLISKISMMEMLHLFHLQFILQEDKMATIYQLFLLYMKARNKTLTHIRCIRSSQ